GLAGLDRHLVVSGVDVAMCDRHVCRTTRVDPIGITRVLWSVNNHAPSREPVTLPVIDVKIGAIAQLDFIKREVIAMRKDHDARAVLILVRMTCLLSQIPPGKMFPKDLFAAPAIDGAFAHHGRMRRMIAIDNGLAAVSAFGQSAADSG